MKRYGYIFAAMPDGELAKTTTRMEGYGLSHLYNDRPCDEVSRPQWHNLLNRLETGDEIILARISNAVRGMSELSAFLELCRMLSVRIVSIGDAYDSHGEIFPEQSPDALEPVLAQLPKDVAQIRNMISARTAPARPLRNSVETKQLHQTVINMYVSGTPLESIMRSAGFSTKKSIFDILKKYNVPRRSTLRRKEPERENLRKDVSDRHAQVISLYRSGCAVKDIASKCGYSNSQQIYRILKDHGVPAARKASSKRHELVLGLYDSGKTIGEIAQVTGYTRQTVYSIVKDAGIIRAGEPWSRDGEPSN